MASSLKKSMSRSTHYHSESGIWVLVKAPQLRLLKRNNVSLMSKILSDFQRLKIGYYSSSFLSLILPAIRILQTHQTLQWKREQKMLWPRALYLIVCLRYLIHLKWFLNGLKPFKVNKVEKDMDVLLNLGYNF